MAAAAPAMRAKGERLAEPAAPLPGVVLVGEVVAEAKTRR